MKVGDLVKSRLWTRLDSPTKLDSGGVGIVVKQAPEICLGPAWWSIQWSNGETESVRIGNLEVINESR